MADLTEAVELHLGETDGQVEAERGTPAGVLQPADLTPTEFLAALQTRS